MDIMFIEDDRVGLFLGATRLEILKHLDEDFDFDDDLTLPYAVCEDLFTRVAQKVHSGWKLAQCEFEYLFNELGDYALKTVRCDCGLED